MTKNSETNRKRREENRRKVIEHYSNGTNKCSIEGCDAPYEVLTVEHEEFNVTELAEILGSKWYTTGSGLYAGLAINNCPDVNISIKCMAHNAQNKNMRGFKRSALSRSKNRDHIHNDYVKICFKCKLSLNQSHFALKPTSKDGLQSSCKVCDNLRRKLQAIEVVKTAYALYGYHGPHEHMTWEHSNNDGNIHRRYLGEKYKYKNVDSICGRIFAALLIREYKAGIPNYPGLIVVHANDNHVSMKAYRAINRKESNE